MPRLRIHWYGYPEPEVSEVPDRATAQQELDVAQNSQMSPGAVSAVYIDDDGTEHQLTPADWLSDTADHIDGYDRDDLGESPDY